MTFTVSGASLVSNPASTYQINNSLRFRASASAYLNRTFGTPTNAIKWTVSCWIKRGTISSVMDIFGSYVNTSTYGVVDFLASNQIAIYATNSVAWLITNNVFRDPSAWYHLVVRYDSANATASNRVNIYINGVECSYATDNRASYQNQASGWNRSGTSNGIGAGLGSISGYFDGYIDEFHHIDGQALTPSSFGQTNPATGVWEPIKYTGTYGTNGFYLNFSNIALTSGSNTGLGQDFSGNGNYWTTNNISVTAGSTYDAMIDSPTLGTVGTQPVGNYAVMNPLKLNTNGSLAGANLNWSSSAAGGLSVGTIGVSNGKWYWEFVNSSSNNTGIGVFDPSAPLATYIENSTNGIAYYSGNGNVYYNGGNSAYGNTFTTNDIIGVALDLDNGKIYFSKNGIWQNSGNPETQTNPARTGLNGTYAPAINSGNVSASASANFGQRPFSYTPPTGFQALCTTNLPNSTIVKGNKYMDATLLTGSLSNQSITSLSFAPDFLWSKNRSGGVTDHGLYDTIRGGNRILSSNLTSAELTTTAAVVTFLSNGATLQGGGSVINDSGRTYVEWWWNAGSGVNTTNTDGSLASVVSVNKSAGFSVVTFSPQASGSGTVGHGLGVAPKMIITKRRNSTNDWITWHTSLSSTEYILLNTTAAKVTGATTFWNSTLPTASVFSLGSAFAASADNYVAYCWAEIAGFSRFGSYTGNGSADGPFVYCGFRPKFVMMKRTDGAGSWFMIDTTRAPYNVVNPYLLANVTNIEATDLSWDILSNGFKLRTTNIDLNASAGTYIFMAFAENPFKNALAR
jgi:hypothetical protein